MSNSCKIVPNAPNGKPSKLFNELRTRTKDRELTKTVWALTQTDLFKGEFGDLAKDENGEVTYQALSEVLGLDNILDRAKKDIGLAVDTGIIDEKGESVKFDNAQTAIERASDYNSEARDKIAVVEETDNGGYAIRIQDKTLSAISQSETQKTKLKLNKKLIDLVHRLGFDVSFSDNPSYDGVFNPLLADKNASGLKTVIDIAKGERGEEAIPEEVCHLIIAGLENNQIKERIDKLFTPEIVRGVLGDRYDAYSSKYKNGRTPLDIRLRDEAEGQVLAAILKGDNAFFDAMENNTRRVVNQSRNPFRRLWEKAKSLFRKGNKDDVDKAIAEIRQTFSTVSQMVEDETIDDSLDKEAIMNHEALFDLADRVAEAKEMAEEGERILGHRLYILEQTSADSDTRELRDKLDLIRKKIVAENYYSACLTILETIGADLEDIILQAEHLGHVYKPASDLYSISANAGLVNRMSNSIDGYTKYLLVLQKLPEMVKAQEIEMTPSGAKKISDLATKYLNSFTTMQHEIKVKRFNVLRQMISLFYGNNGEKPENFKETDKIKWQSAEMILREAERDISWWDTNIFSAGDSRNILINVIHHIITSQQRKRDNMINSYIMKIQSYDAKLKAAGHDNNFIFQLDENGKPTGYYLSDIDKVGYEKARAEFISLLDAQEMDVYDRRDAIRKWEEENTVKIQVGEPIGPNGERRIEIQPDPAKYGNPEFENIYNSWDQAQKDYYNAILDMKAEMDSVLPMPMRDQFKAPQVRKSVSQMFDKDGPGAIKTLFAQFKQRFSVMKENTEYGEYLEVPSDFSGRPIKRVPIYYTNMLEDMSDLSTDGTYSMSNYICMAVNFSEMSQLASAMKLMQDYVTDDKDGYKVKMRRGDKIMKSIYTAGRIKYGKDFEERGLWTRASNAIYHYIDRNVFNMTKQELPKIQITEDKAIDLNTIHNLFVRLTSFSRMGLNPLSAITNVTQGECQILGEAISGRFFGLKDAAWAKKEYFALLFDYMGQFNTANPHSRMHLLNNQFNAGEDFFMEARSRNFNKNPFKRVLGRGNIQFMNTMGEHYLHTAGMLMIFKHEKVKLLNDSNHKVVSLYDAIKEVEDENGWHLELVDDIEFVNKNRAFLNHPELRGKEIITKDDRDPLFESLAEYINNINAGMHGGYSQAERGNANRIFIFEWLLQFRQWMFGMYNKLYSGSYYDAVMNMQREGGFVSIFKFMKGAIHDMKNMSIKMAIENNRMTQEEKENARIAYANMGLVVFFSLLTAMTGGLPDEDDRAKRLLAYSLKRLELETGALTILPRPGMFFDNFFTLVQSPAAGIQTLEQLTSLFDIMNIWEEVNSGRYKGWSKAEKALFTLTPLYNIQKLIDMKDYNYMFNIFN